jgi:hypothetical protein
MRYALAIVVIFASRQAVPSSKALAEVRKTALLEVNKLRTEMAKRNARAEISDCDNVAAKILLPSKAMPEKSASAPYPGDKAYEEVLTLWAEAGPALAKIYKDGQAELKDAELEEAKTFEGWFATWPDLAQGIRHLNARRKFCKLAPVTQDWSASIGGYYHGIYLKKNKDQPGTQGLGAHNEDRKLPGFTPEGEKAAGGILAWGRTAEGIFDMWLNSRFHRHPVLSPECARVAFGGGQDGGYSCREAPGGSNKALAELVTWPGDGDTDIPTTFGGELPNPFPPGVTSAGTVLVLDFRTRQPKKLDVKLLDAGGKSLELLGLDTKNPYCYCAKSALQGKSKYTVEALSSEGAKITYSFTTR